MSPEYVPLTPQRPIAAEDGARIGISSCQLCGAAIVFDPADDDPTPLAVHIAWHERMEAENG